MCCVSFGDIYFQALVVSWGVVERLQAHSQHPNANCLFSPEEVHQAQRDLAPFFQNKGFDCSTKVSPYQPFLFEAWSALAACCDDKDALLPPLWSSNSIFSYLGAV